MTRVTDNRLLMHICCAPCSGALLQLLAGEGYQATGFWFNPNIHPMDEWNRRRSSVSDMSVLMNMPMRWTEDFQQTEWQERFNPENQERCDFCYDIRLEAVASLASREGFMSFSTSLLTSPHQNHEAVRRAGERASERYGIPFLYRDFRHLYREGRNLARARGWYMQKYCGCVLSYSESDHPKKPVYDFNE